MKKPHATCQPERRCGFIWFRINDYKLIQWKQNNLTFDFEICCIIHLLSPLPIRFSSLLVEFSKYTTEHLNNTLRHLKLMLGQRNCWGDITKDDFQQRINEKQNSYCLAKEIRLCGRSRNSRVQQFAKAYGHSKYEAS